MFSKSFPSQVIKNFPTILQRNIFLEKKIINAGPEDLSRVGLKFEPRLAVSCGAPINLEKSSHSSTKSSVLGFGH